MAKLNTFSSLSKMDRFGNEPCRTSSHKENVQSVSDKNKKPNTQTNVQQNLGKKNTGPKPNILGSLIMIHTNIQKINLRVAVFKAS